MGSGQSSLTNLEAAPPPLLEVADLRTYFRTDAGVARAVDGVSFSIEAGKTLAVVGESGCGKTVTALSILRLIPEPPGEFVSGSICLDGEDLLRLRPDELRRIRGGKVSMIFQEPGTSLNPVITVGDQIGEAIRLHRNLPRGEIRGEVLRCLRDVHVSDPERRIDQYPHELSGGMKQRVMIAMALSCNPRLLIADEPTTAVDVTIQARILNLLRQMQSEFGMSILLITHDLGVVAEMADEVVVMYAGKVIEQAPVHDLFERPHHPYTIGLFNSLPRVDENRTRLQVIEGSVPAATRFPDGCRFRERCKFAVPECTHEPPLEEIGHGHRVACWMKSEVAASIADRRLSIVDCRLNLIRSAVHHPPSTIHMPPLLDVRDLRKHFPVRGGLMSRVREWVKAVDGVSFSLDQGRTLGLVGESGCGKTTVGRTLLRLTSATSGEVRFLGRDILSLRRRELLPLRRQMQIIFQDPYGSLNPRLTIEQIVGEPLAVHGVAAGPTLRDEVASLLKQVGLRPEVLNRYPHEFSGGQRQRIGIARALALKPAFIVCDEPTSALDVSIRAQIINLLQDLQAARGLSYLMISHDLAVVRHISNSVAVMYLGKVVEQAPTEQLYTDPRHPYTKVLLAAIPVPNPRQRRSSRQRVEAIDTDDTVPSPIHVPPGCPFHPRCPLYAAKGQPEQCRSVAPNLQQVSGQPEHLASCHFADLPEAV